jgi:hypothetical protein
MNSKGQFGNILLVSIIIVVVILSSIIGFVILKKYDTATAGVLSTEAHDIVTKAGNSWIVWDYAVLFLAVGTIIALGISALFIRTHPAMFFFTMIMLILELFLVPMLSNVMYEIKNSAGINATVNVSSSFPIMNYVSNNLPLIMAFAIAIFLIIFFGKPSLSQQGGEGNVY